MFGRKITFSGLVHRIMAELYMLANRRSFRSAGRNIRIYSPLKIQDKKYISLHDHVTVEYKSWLMACPLTGEPDCLLEIGENSVLGHFNHIVATKKVRIGKNVLTADKVYIADNLHTYENIHEPVIRQPIKQIGEVEIGDGSWLGEHVCVIGAKIGKHCVIGANSVVTKDIPDFSVAVGSPAKVIKRYNPASEQWEKVK